jgi:alanine racemase
MPDKPMVLDAVHASWCDIYPERIKKNLQLAHGLLPEGAQLLAVLKADAYGHGIARVVPIIREQGVKYVGITSNTEARVVRAAGFMGTIMRIRSATLSEIEGALPDQVQEQVSTLYAAELVDKLACDGAKISGLHLSLNAGGMSRDGLELATRQGRKACLEIIDLIGPHILGICSHFPSNAPQELASSNRKFQKEVAWVFANSALNRSDVLVHAGSSLSLVSGQNVTTDLFRCGAIMYGILRQDLGFRPTMELKSVVTNLATFPKGSTIGYDRATILQDDRRLANISIGYANGIRRDFFSQSAVLIRGRKLPILGKISMNTFTADVTDLPEVAVGDEVVVFGQQGAACIDIKTMELQADTIIADVFSDWGQRNHRIYVE